MLLLLHLECDCFCCSFLPSCSLCACSILLEMELAWLLPVKNESSILPLLWCKLYVSGRALPGLKGFPLFSEAFFTNTSWALARPHPYHSCVPPPSHINPKSPTPIWLFQRLRCIYGDGFIVLSLLPFLGVIPLIHFPMKNQNYIPGGMSTCWFYSICWKFLCISIWSVIFPFYLLRLFFFMVL